MNSHYEKDEKRIKDIINAEVKTTDNRTALKKMYIKKNINVDNLIMNNNFQKGLFAQSDVLVHIWS